MTSRNHAGPPYGVALPLPHHLVTQFPDPSWIENIAVRANGDLLLTQSSFLPGAQLFSVDPSGPSPIAATVAHTFPTVTTLLGITEAAPDLFVLVGGNATTPGSFFAWTIDFGRAAPGALPVVTEIAHLADAVVPNGVTSVPAHGHGEIGVVLVADSIAGVVWRVDVASGAYEVAVQVPELARPPGANSSVVGANGLKWHKGYLYWTNSVLVGVYRVKVGRDGKVEDGAVVEKVAAIDASFLDDFAVDEDGVVWVVTNSDNRLLAVRAGSGESVVVEGGVGDLTVLGGTAAAFGRGRSDGKVLYVTTCGGIRGSLLYGGTTEGAKVVAVDTQGFRF
ncbi:hypothetical protein B0H67DRAFT_482473 [Lasiosphaeris hirsuta]|uniref:SMP-30/Gluconolactonase/LRE-like region domain-containing protein n=1 Tax=Lasiosphaeris hirsuta TaxID=260670 RepID=A0AA40AY86_9PEZI|nr:hypothetical protein B0H67DRAFT_482473 [Lasiosphaeris hirsuta]